jgi:hypothetical protein
MNQETDELNQKNSKKSSIYDNSEHNHTSRTVKNVTLDPETCIFVKSVPRIDLNEILPKNPPLLEITRYFQVPTERGTKDHEWANVNREKLNASRTRCSRIGFRTSQH